MKFKDWLSEAFGSEPKPKPEREPSPKPEREPSPMQFDPEDVNAKCDICGAGMSYYGPHAPENWSEVRMALKFSCRAAWVAPNEDDLYWTEYSQCGKATDLYRVLRSKHWTGSL